MSRLPRWWHRTYLVVCVLAGIGSGWFAATPYPFAIWHPFALVLVWVATFFAIEGACFMGLQMLLEAHDGE